MAVDRDVDQAALIDLRAVMRVIRRRALIIMVTLATALVLAAVAYLAAEPRYFATAQVALDRAREQVIKVDQVVPGVDPDSAAVDTEVEILRSPQLIGRVVDALRLDRDPDFNKALEDQPAPPAGARPDPIARQRAIGAVLGGLDVERDGLSYAISVGFEAAEAATAARVANAVVREYVDQQVDAKAGATQRASQFLEKRLADLRSQVLGAERAVADFRAANDLFAISSASTVSQEELSNLSTQRAQAQAENAAAQARLATARAQLARGRSGAELGESLDSPVVSALRSQRAEIGREAAALEARYGERHPELRRVLKARDDTDAQIAAEVRRIVANTAIQANIAQQRAASLSGSIGQAEGKLAADNAAGVRLNELERNAESARTLYQAYLDRYRQTVAQSGLERSDSYIIAEARVPGAPHSPNLLLYLAAALVGGLGLAAVLVLVLQLLERGVETSESVERRFGMPTLASIPDAGSLPGYRKTGPPAPPIDLIVRRPESMFAEAFRTLRTSILFATPGLGHRVVAIASSVPGEGKTTAAICLARSAALSGTRTLLIDCDPRRRAVTRTLAGTTRLGLGDLLAGEATLDQVMLVDETSGACILPQRTEAFTADPADDAAFAALLTQLRDRFELILLDTPPVLAVDEARVLASMADGVVMLVRWRRTAAKAAEHALKQLYEVNANVLGVVLSNVDVEEQARSGFGDAGYYLNEVKAYHNG